MFHRYPGTVSEGTPCRAGVERCRSTKSSSKAKTSNAKSATQIRSWQDGFLKGPKAYDKQHSSRKPCGRSGVGSFLCDMRYRGKRMEAVQTASKCRGGRVGDGGKDCGSGKSLWPCKRSHPRTVKGDAVVMLRQAAEPEKVGSCPFRPFSRSSRPPSRSAFCFQCDVFGRFSFIFFSE